jgi:hypothetical protein
MDDDEPFVCDECGRQSRQAEGTNWCVACVRDLIDHFEMIVRLGWNKSEKVLYEPGKLSGEAFLSDGLTYPCGLEPEQYNEQHGTRAVVMSYREAMREMIAVVRPDYVPSWELIDD